MSNKGIKSKAEQLFVFDRWGSFIGIAHSTVKPLLHAEDIACHIIQQALAEIATVLNNEAKHD